MIKLTSGKTEVYPHFLKKIDVSSYTQGTKNHYVKIISARDPDYFPVTENNMTVSQVENGKFTILSSVLCEVKWELYGENDIESILKWHPMV